MPGELSDSIHQEITTLCAEGDRLADAGHGGEALTSYMQALGLLPEPKLQWQAFTWTQAAIGDVYFARGDWANCRAAFREAVQGADGLGNPFIHLRLGQCALELGDEDSAKDELMRAYMGDGEAVFEGAEKYLEFLGRYAILPKKPKWKFW